MRGERIVAAALGGTFLRKAFVVWLRPFSLVHYHFSITKEATTIKSTRILTPDMYRAEVGEEKYELYTEW